jgi:hypothetical protein
MRVVISAKGDAVSPVGVDVAPRTLQDSGAEQILHQLHYIVVASFLPAIGDPVLGVDFHTGNLSITCLSGKD